MNDPCNRCVPITNYVSFQCDAEVNFLEGHVGLPQYTPQPQPGSQLEMVLVEARRLEEVAHRNEDELRLLALERGDEEDPNIRAEIMQLKQRLVGTDQELQKTNQTLRYVYGFSHSRAMREFSRENWQK